MNYGHAPDTNTTIVLAQNKAGPLVAEWTCLKEQTVLDD